jgi:peptidoglycan/xylan/chitin deacetylase (PgdA/CDA1 family)
MSAPTPIILRIDDIGASSKQYEQYGKSPFRIGARTIPVPSILNWGGLKRLPMFRSWGPYREMKASEWEKVFELLTTYKARLTVCVTACWVEADSTLTPFPEKFPEEAAILKKGLEKGLIEIGNHGLTHCVVGRHLPHPFKGNRSMHREFWDWLPEETIAEHIKESQRILTDYFGEIVTFTPPGNQWTDYTEEVAAKEGLRFLSARFPQGHRQPHLTWTTKQRTYAFHDRELVLDGTNWLKKLLEELEERNEQACTVRELYA